MLLFVSLLVAICYTFAVGMITARVRKKRRQQEVAQEQDRRYLNARVENQTRALDEKKTAELHLKRKIKALNAKHVRLQAQVETQLREKDAQLHALAQDKADLEARYLAKLKAAEAKKESIAAWKKKKSTRGRASEQAAEIIAEQDK